MKVLVTTSFGGVFAGELKRHNEDTKVAVLRNARNCVSWSADVHGVFGLASKGPTSKCRVGPRVPSLILDGVTSVTQMTDVAVAAWESEPWS